MKHCLSTLSALQMPTVQKRTENRLRIGYTVKLYNSLVLLFKLFKCDCVTFKLMWTRIASNSTNEIKLTNLINGQGYRDRMNRKSKLQAPTSIKSSYLEFIRGLELQLSLPDNTEMMNHIKILQLWEVAIAFNHSDCNNTA